MQNLKAAREEKGLTQEKLAEILNVSRVTIARYESGDRWPDCETLLKLADITGCSVDYLLGRELIKTEKVEKLPQQPDEGRERMQLVIDKNMIGDAKALEEYIRAVVRNEMNK